jgi:5-methylcytosine-specific restriction protein B
VDAYRGKGSKKNDVSANDDFLNKIMIGDVIIAKKGRGELLGYGIVKSDYFFDKKRENYQKTRKVDWKLTGNWKVDFSLVLKTLTDITKYKSDHPDYSKYYERLLGIMGQNNKIEKKEEMNLPLNTILYGPPGTGKTHILKNQYMDMFTTSESSITRQDFLKDIIQNCSWWQVIALAVLDLGKTKVADIFNHEYVQVKAQLSNSTTVTPTIWGQLQSHTVEDCEHVKVSRRMPPMIFNKTEKSEWEILQNEVEEQSPELLELKSKIENFESIPNKRIERYEFLTFHQSYSYEDFIEGIKPELAESDVSYKIEEGVFQKMCNRARNDSSNNYAIFIDEINRGNISSIFGELITLIEDDKREGKPNEIIATLPYSKKHFSVPKNLYIIGTMNTADRSVEALDTALRRRFSFIEMNPEPKKLGAEEFKCTGIDLEALLNAINARIEKLLDKDYCIGHSYFMSIKNRQSPLEEMKSIFQNKILPLLQEYFYGDWGKILLVIGGEFVESRKSTIKFLSTDRYEDFEEYDEKPIYNFTNPSSWTLDSFKSIYE